MPMLRDREESGLWYECFDWLIPEDFPSLSATSRQYHGEMTDEWTRYIMFMKRSVKDFRDKLKLDDHRFWLDVYDEPRRYVKNLKIYAEMLNNLFCISNRAVELSLKRMSQLQEDLMTVLENVIDR